MKSNIEKNTVTFIGIIFLIIGFGYLISKLLNSTGFLLGSLLIAMILLFVLGVIIRSDLWKICGSILLSFIAGIITGFFIMPDILLIRKIGILMFCFSLSWLFMPLFLNKHDGKSILWPLIPASAIFPFSVIFILGIVNYQDIIFSACIGIGFVLLLWGGWRKIFGLIIPGSLLVSAGIGMFFSLRNETINDPLSQIGILLVCIAFGWFLIAFLSRLIYAKIVWWPLIPGGVFSFVGWGLSAGGNIKLASNLLGNSGSLIVILAGLYLLLCRKDIHK